MDLKPVEADDSVNEYRIRGKYDVFVDRPQIRISLAYMAIDDDDIKKIGNEAALDRGGVLNLGGTVAALSSFIHGAKPDRRQWSNQQGYSADMGLNVLANFLRQNGISRISETGYTVM
jgi:hypothetical protein